MSTNIFCEELEHFLDVLVVVLGRHVGRLLPVRVGDAVSERTAGQINQLRQQFLETKLRCQVKNCGNFLFR